MNRDNLRRVAIWVDHREAIMVLFVGDHLDREKEILAGADSPVRDVNLPRYHLETHRHEVLKQYYDDVIQRLGPVDEILILGPGQAKHELRKRILRRFRQEGINIPFPIRTVHLQGIPENLREALPPADRSRA